MPEPNGKASPKPEKPKTGKSSPGRPKVTRAEKKTPRSADTGRKAPSAKPTDPKTVSAQTAFPKIKDATGIKTLFKRRTKRHTTAAEVIEKSDIAPQKVRNILSGLIKKGKLERVFRYEE